MFNNVAFWILLEREIEFLIESNDRGDTILVVVLPIFGSHFHSSLGGLIRTSFELQMAFP